MQQKLQMVEFGVAGLEEVRTLVKRWKKVLAGLAREDEAPYQVWQNRRQVGIEVEDRRPGEEVLLTFLAPREVVERFLADLRTRLALQVEECARSRASPLMAQARYDS